MASGLFNAALPIFEGFSGQFALGAAFYVTARYGSRVLPIFLRSVRGLPAPHSLYQRRLIQGFGTSGNLEDLQTGDDAELLPDPEEDVPPLDRPPTEPDPPLGSGFEYHLNPLQIIFRAVSVPVLGVIDIAIRKSTAVAYGFVSLFYHAFPLSNMSRMSRFLRIFKRTEGFEPYPIPDLSGDLCSRCSRQINKYVVNYPRRILQERCCCSRVLRWRQGFWLVHRDHYTPRRQLTETRVFDNVQAFEQLDNRLSSLALAFGQHEWTPCDHPQTITNAITSTYEIPSPTPDGLYWQQPHQRWRCEERSGGLRCVYHYTNTLHNWHPEIVRAIRRELPDNLPRRVLTNADDVLEVIYLVADWCERHLQVGYHYFLQAISSNRVGSYRHSITQEARIFIIDDPSVKVQLISDYPSLSSKQTLWLCLPIVNTMVSFASWRLVLMLVNPIRCWVHSINQSLTGYQSTAIAVVKRARINLSSLEIGSCWPFFMGNAIVLGATIWFDARHFAVWFTMVGDCYGFDELYVMVRYQPAVIIYQALGIPSVMAPVVSPTLKPFTIVTFVIVDAERSVTKRFTCDFTRERVAQMRMIALSPVSYSNLGFWHGFFDPRPLDLTNNIGELIEVEIGSPLAHKFAIMPNNLPGENVLAEASHMTGGIVFFTFGSRGDRNPVLAHANRLAYHGAKVIVYHLATIDEGRILAGSNSDDEESRVSLFVRAREEIRKISAPLAYVPSQLLIVGAYTYSLLPPDDIIYPFKASDNVLVALSYTILGLFTSPDFYIGGYSRPYYLPTSIDGKNFLEYRPNTGKTGSAKAYWGGDNTIPAGYEHIEQFPPGDHAEMFPTVETVYTKGTAGAVALAAASGARAVSVDDRLDRAYRNPDDCGAGTGIGTDPDAIFLALGARQTVYLGIWARKNWWRIDKLFAWYGISGLAMNAFKALMLYLLFSRYQKPSMISGDPLTSLLMLVLNVARMSLWQYIFIFAIAKMTDKVLTSMGRDYYWLTTLFVTHTSQLLDSIPALWAAQVRSLGVGYLVVVALNLLNPVWDGVMAWATHTLLRRYTVYQNVNDLWVYELSIRWHILPVFHCALVRPRDGSRFEGVRDEFGHYSFQIKPGGYQSPILFPTSITTDMMINLPHIIERYGICWNCQVGLYRLFPGQLHLLGLGVFPVVLHTCGALLLATITTSAVVVTYGLSLFLPSLAGIRYTRHGQVRILGDMVANLIDALATGYAPRAILNWFSGLGIL